jgi:molybdopterin/thiamine biosynthesis adenylyltransferase
MLMIRPRIKETHRPIKLPDGRIWIGSVHYGLGSELSGPHADLAWQVCQVMDGHLTQDELVAEIAGSTGADRSLVKGVVSYLIASGWVDDVGAPVPATLSQRDLQRYKSSAQFLSWVDLTSRSSPYELQARLKSSWITVVGLGGAGCAVATSLAASGVGRLHIVDGDVVELSNLNRQVLYTEAEIGKPKTDAAVRRLSALNSDIEITGTSLFMEEPADIRREISGSDLFVLCADRPDEILTWANQVSLVTGIPWVLAAYTGPMLVVGTFIPGKTGCYRCVMDPEEERIRAQGKGEILDMRRPEGYNPVMAPTAQMAGHVAALEVIYYLLDLNVQTAGHMLHHNFLDYQHQYSLGPGYSDECPHRGARNG